MTVGFERAKVMLFVRVVGVAKVVVHFDGFDDPGDGFGAKGGDTRRHDSMAMTAADILPQVVVESSDTTSVASGSNLTLGARV